MSEDVNRVVLSGPISTKTTFALGINGPFRSKEVGNIITQLTILKEWFEEDEREKAAAEEAMATDQDEGPTP